ncbi:MAG: TonB-dependent receptor [Bacteroidota bacterium]
MQKFILLFACLFLFGQAFGQKTGVIRGVVFDRDTHEPVEFANVLVLSPEGIGTTTDIDGTFRLEGVPVGFQNLEVSFIGYDSHYENRIEVRTAKEVVLEINLKPTPVQIEGVEVVAYSNKMESLSDVPTLSYRPFRPKEIELEASNANDPGRWAMSQPGVQASRDTRSDVVVRGNSSVGILWRLEGIDIPNPNHFARRGSSGGGITIFSMSMLDRSQFSSGAFSANYGNAFSGVFDMRFRRGNLEQREHTVRAGILGLDVSTEGPIQQGQSSYLVNYRYSTLGILNNLGIFLVGERIDNTFQDLSFKTYFKGNGKGAFQNASFWGIGGLSSEIESPVDPVEDWVSIADKTAYSFETNMGALGVNTNWKTGKNSFLQLAVAGMGQQVVVQDDTVDVNLNSTMINREDFINNRLTFAAHHNDVLSGDTARTRVRLFAGAYASQLFYNLQHDSLSFVNFEESTILAVEGNTTLVQGYAQLLIEPSPRLSITPGVHILHLLLNNTTSVEPRLSALYRLNETQSLSFGYGLHGRMLPIGTYFTQIRNPGNGQIEMPNMDLEMPQAHHFVLAYDVFTDKRLHVRAEAYYQQMNRVPVGADTSTIYWIFNDIQGYSTVPLTGGGQGRNYGLDLIVEKFFEDESQVRVSASVFDSRFRVPHRDEWFNTQYNSRVSASVVGSKVWRTKADNKWILATKVLFNGGLPLTPLLDVSDVNSVFPPEDIENPFGESIQPYIRPDLRIAYQKNGAVTWLLALDIQNFISYRNVDGLERNYDPVNNEWVFRRQSGLTPLISYRIDF